MTIRNRKINRRGFLKSAFAVGGAMMAGPYVLRSAEPGKKLNMAFIGTGGQGRGHLWLGRDNNCVCYCDVNQQKWPKDIFPNAPGYTDYRKMFDKHMKEIDAVVIATPDHSHAVATMMALKAGKHCYTEKPLTWSISEARALAEETARQKVATQMGNHGHANEGNRRVVEWVRGGVLGDIKEVHTWTSRPIWPQGINRPPTKPVPAGLDWDSWIGPAQFRDYHDNLDSFNWRGWFDFGCGAIGDMGCHTWDCIYWAMDPDYPTNIELLKVEGKTKETYPKSSCFKWVFPAKGSRPGFDAYWYEGGMKPEAPEEFVNDPFRKQLTNSLGKDGKPELPKSGTLFYGTKGKMLVQGDYSDSLRLIPETFQQEAKLPDKSIPRSPGHKQEWIMACKGEKPWDFPGSNFAKYAGPLTEVMLLGTITQRIGEIGFKIECDPVKREIKTKEALAFIGREYRKGWSL